MTLSQTDSLEVKLSRREVEVLELMAAGLDSKEAANVLFVSKRTVDFHLTRIYRKLGTGNRVLALSAARRAGILPAEL